MLIDITLIRSAMADLARADLVDAKEIQRLLDIVVEHKNKILDAPSRDSALAVPGLTMAYEQYLRHITTKLSQCQINKLLADVPFSFAFLLFSNSHNEAYKNVITDNTISNPYFIDSCINEDVFLGFCDYLIKSRSGFENAIRVFFDNLLRYYEFNSSEKIKPLIGKIFSKLIDHIAVQNDDGYKQWLNNNQDQIWAGDLLQNIGRDISYEEIDALAKKGFIDLASELSKHCVTNVDFLKRFKDFGVRISDSNLPQITRNSIDLENFFAYVACAGFDELNKIDGKVKIDLEHFAVIFNSKRPEIQENLDQFIPAMINNTCRVSSLFALTMPSKSEIREAIWEYFGRADFNFDFSFDAFRFKKIIIKSVSLLEYSKVTDVLMAAVIADSLGQRIPKLSFDVEKHGHERIDFFAEHPEFIELALSSQNFTNSIPEAAFKTNLFEKITKFGDGAIEILKKMPDNIKGMPEAKKLMLSHDLSL